MLYVPETNFLFVHIPRTAGNAITRTLVAELVAYRDVIVSTVSGHGDVARHSTAMDCMRELAIDNQATDVWYIDRPNRQIIHSDYELWKGLAPENGEPGSEFAYKARVTQKGSFAFTDYWRDILRKHDCETITEFFVRGSVNPRPVLYNEIAEKWPLICEAAGCRRVPELPRLDFEMSRKHAGYYKMGVYPR